MNTDTEGDRLTGWRKWITVAGMVAIVVLFGLVLVGCDNPFRDDGSADDGNAPVAAQEPDEIYISVTNATGQTTTVPITVTADNGATVIIGDGNTFTSAPVDNSSQDRISEGE